MPPPRSDSRAGLLRCPVIALDGTAPLGPVAAPAKWVQIAYEGDFKGHAAGEFTLTPEVFAQAVANFHAHPSYKPGAEQAPPADVEAGRFDVIPWDFHHASEQAPTTGTIPVAGAPAQGWVLELQVRAGADGKAQLWALTRWLEPLRSYVAEGKYRWCSMTLYPSAVDPVSGAEVGAYISSVAATNDPFLQGMVPLAASRALADADAPASGRSGSANGAVESDGRRDSRMDPTLKLLADRLSIPAEPDSVLKAVKLRLDAGESATTGLKAILSALGVEDVDGATAKLAQMFKQVDELEKAMPELSALREQKAATEETEAEEEVAEAMQAHRMPASAKVALLHLRRANPGEFRKSYPSAPRDKAHLTQAFFAGGSAPTQLGATHGAAPLAPPPAPGVNGPVNLSAYKGRNVTEQALAYLDATDPNAKKLSMHERYATARRVVASATA